MFTYSERDFLYVEQDFAKTGQSALDDELERAFTKAMDKGMLRYRQEKDANELKSIVAPNGCAIIAEFNTNRGFNKRARRPFASVSMPFDPESFNFNKIKSDEILFPLKSSLSMRGDEILALVNISPINFCHNLYVINPRHGHPQRLTMEASRVAFDLVRLSAQPGFRAMFNSLQAWASINHLHLHSMNVPHQLGMDVCPSLPLRPGGAIRRLCPASTLFDGFVLNLRNETDLEEIVTSVERIVTYFNANNIAYNVVWSRGSDVIDGERVTRLVRCLIWPRASGEGLHPHPAFDNACAELGGHLPIKTRDSFDQLDGAWAYERLRMSSLAPQQLDEIVSVLSKF